MKPKWSTLKGATKLLVTGIVATSLASLNMGGCSDAGKAISDAASTVGGSASVLSTGGHGGGSADTVQRALTGVQGAGQALHGLNLSDEEERALGECVALQGADRYGVVHDDALNRYVTMVAQTITDATAGGGKPVAFVLASNDINAYSGPTGYVMITRGLLNQLQDESELAGVLAHEMGHVVERHGLQTVSASEQAAGFQKIGEAAAGRQAGLVGLGAGLVKNVFGVPYSQGQESQADTDAVRFMVAAGYDPEGYIRALQRLQSVGAGRREVLSTHPNIGDRINSVRGEIGRLGARGGATNQARFQATAHQKGAAGAPVQ